MSSKRCIADTRYSRYPRRALRCFGNDDMPFVRPSGVALLMTGDELMRGDTIDSNSAKIAQALIERGVLIREKATVGDDRVLLTTTIARLAKDHAVLIINGGLGPTSDDLTAEILAQLAGGSLIEHPKARHHVEQWCERRGITANRANLKQALVPDGAVLIDNPRGSAMGLAIDLGQCRVIATPGVPSELQAMMEAVLDNAAECISTESVHTLRLQTFGIGESTIEQRLIDANWPWPDEVTLGFRAGLPLLELKLTVQRDAHIPQQQACLAHLETLLGDHIIGRDNSTLAGALQQVLRAQGKTVTAAESCTGGLIASMITREPGSSAVFNAGFVSYSNHMKTSLLGVDATLLAHQGAVSESVVQHMLLGALEHANADVGVAVSGIAGPDGGTADKPVGTVWLAWGSREDLRTRRVVIPGSREFFQTLVAAAGLDLVRRFLLGLPAEPHYFARQSM